MEKNIASVILSFLLFVFSQSVLADYTLKSVYKFENSSRISDGQGSFVLNVTVIGVGETSQGNRLKNTCVVQVKNKKIDGVCEAVDQDGDKEYTTVIRDMSKGNSGTITRTGGTGKYENTRSICEYIVEITDFGIGVGYLTASCKE